MSHLVDIRQSAHHLRLLDFLYRNRDRWMMGAELATFQFTLNYARDVSDIRQNGFPVECHYHSTNENGRRVSVFRLTKEGAEKYEAEFTHQPQEV